MKKAILILLIGVVLVFVIVNNSSVSNDVVIDEGAYYVLMEDNIFSYPASFIDNIFYKIANYVIKTIEDIVFNMIK